MIAPTAIRSRGSIAASRIKAAREALGECRLCAHNCGVNRLRGELGHCKATAETRVFLSQTEVSDEAGISPVFAIAFSGCDMRCDFCITGGPSWNPQIGEPFHAEALAAKATHALANGARSIMFLGGEPTIHLPAALELLAALPDDAPVIWKSNMHMTAPARDLLHGLCNLWLADYKFGNDSCAQRLSKTSNYTAILQENLLWAAANEHLMIRHLLMPGHVDCCWKPVAHWIAAELPEVQVSLMTGFWAGWQSHRHPELQSPISTSETARAFDIARDAGLTLAEWHLVPPATSHAKANSLNSELMIMPDGKIMAHNLTPVMAGILAELNPNDSRILYRETTRVGPEIKRILPAHWDDTPHE